MLCEVRRHLGGPALCTGVIVQEVSRCPFFALQLQLDNECRLPHAAGGVTLSLFALQLQPTKNAVLLAAVLLLSQRYHRLPVSSTAWR